MIGFNFIIRLLLAAVVFYFMGIQWSLVPYLNVDIPLETTFLSVFFGVTPPSGEVRILVLLSRFLIGLAVTLYILIPGFRYFFEFNAESYNKAIAQLMGLAAVAVFFTALILQHLYYT